MLIDSAAVVSPSPAQAPSSSGGKLGAGALTQVRVANYCGPTPTTPVDIAIILPGGGGTVIAKPHAGVSSVDAIPPCSGPNGAEIDMNGWRPPP